MKYSKYFGTKQRGFIKSKSVLAPKGAIHLLNENIRYDTIKNVVFEVIIYNSMYFIFKHRCKLDTCGSLRLLFSCIDS